MHHTTKTSKNVRQSSSRQQLSSLKSTQRMKTKTTSKRVISSLKPSHNHSIVFSKSSPPIAPKSAPRCLFTTNALPNFKNNIYQHHYTGTTMIKPTMLQPQFPITPFTTVARCISSVPHYNSFSRLKLEQISPMSLNATMFKISNTFTTTSQQMSTEAKHEEVGVTPPTQQEDTIFGKMTRGEIKVPTVYEDDKCIVINDIQPQAKRHMLVIPRKPISQISKATDDDADLFGHLFNVARKVAASEGLEGYRLVINNGQEGCQSVYHIHIHILGGQQLSGNMA